MVSQTDYSDYKVYAKLSNIKTFTQALKAVNIDESATFQISSEGMRIYVENSKFLQSNFYINSTCFDEFIVPEDEIIRFSVNLNVTTECLGIFTGLDCKMVLTYKDIGSPFVLLMEYNDPNSFTTECSIKTKHFQDPSEYEINQDCPKYNYIWMAGHYLNELFLELDRSADELEIQISPTAPNFKVTTIGVMQSESDFEVGRSSDMIINFKSKEKTCARYKLSHIRTMLKALNLSHKVAIMTDASGLLEAHLMVSKEKESEMYITFYITPLVDYE